MPPDLPSAISTHAELAASALAVAIAIGLPLGILSARMRGGMILGLAGVGRTLPSLAVLAFMLPIVGVGFTPALLALVVLGIPPIVIGSDVGLRNVASDAIDAARGMGMDARQIFTRVRWPLALPIILDGIRIATIEIIASATLATFIGAGGLGDIIVRGLQTNDAALLYWGTITVALFALVVEALGLFISRTLRKGTS